MELKKDIALFGPSGSDDEFALDAIPVAASEFPLQYTGDVS